MPHPLWGGIAGVAEQTRPGTPSPSTWTNADNGAGAEFCDQLIVKEGAPCVWDA